MGSWHGTRRTLPLHALALMANATRSMSSTAMAFSSSRDPRSWAKVLPSPSSPRTTAPPCFRPLPLRMSALPRAMTGTGWINPESLHLDAALRDSRVRRPAPSPAERLLVRDRLVHVKRDDLLRLPSSHVGGNKARKFLSLDALPSEEFPDALVSFGGPQGNAMVALAAIVAAKNAEEGEDAASSEELVDDLWRLDAAASEGGGDDASVATPPSPSSPETIPATAPKEKKRFVYYTKTLPRYLRKNPNGNLLRALALGMELRAVSHDEYARLFGGLHGGSVLAPADLEPPAPGRSLWVPQGGACGIARPGGDVLAREVVEYWSAQGLGGPLAVCVPGGTCTTALLLHRSIEELLEQRWAEGEEPLDIRVVVIPCVGDDEYALRQMAALDQSVGGTGRQEDLPHVLRPRDDGDFGAARRRSKGYLTFGAPSPSILATYDELNAAGLSLDLLYGAPAWTLLLPHWRSADVEACPIAGRQVMYVHTGGLEGVASQLVRYKHQGLIEAHRLQL